MKIARLALATAICSLGWPVAGWAQAPEKPFISLGDEMRARSTYIIRLSDDVPESRVPSRAAAMAGQAGGVLRR